MFLFPGNMWALLDSIFIIPFITVLIAYIVTIFIMGLLFRETLRVSAEVVLSFRHTSLELANPRFIGQNNLNELTQNSTTVNGSATQPIHTRFVIPTTNSGLTFTIGPNQAPMLGGATTTTTTTTTTSSRPPPRVYVPAMHRNPLNGPRTRPN